MTTTTKTTTKKKKTAGASPTARSLKKLRSEGYTAQVVEHWNPWARIRQDLFNFIDIVAVHGTQYDIVAVQTTSRENMSARIKKIMSLDAAKDWSQNGCIHVHGWDKYKNRWRCKVVAMYFCFGALEWETAEMEENP